MFEIIGTKSNDTSAFHWTVVGLCILMSEFSVLVVLTKQVLFMLFIIYDDVSDGLEMGEYEHTG